MEFNHRSNTLVLVVDDGSDKTVVKSNLSYIGYSKVFEVPDPEYAIKLAKTRKFHLVFLGNLRFGDYSSLEIGRKIREDGLSQKATIIGLTYLPFKESFLVPEKLEEIWLEAGFNGCIDKLVACFSQNNLEFSGKTEEERKKLKYGKGVALEEAIKEIRAKAAGLDYSN